MTPTGATSLSQLLRERITEEASTWIELPLLAGIQDGTLDPALFRNYLEQDYLYLRYYARIYARLAAASATTEDLEHFVALAHGVIGTELGFHKSAAEPFGCDFDAARPSAELREYVDFYEEHSASAGETLVAMLPCLFGYGIALQPLKRAAPGPYTAWVDIYTSGNYADIMERHFAMLDEADIPVERALEIADRGLELERAFWNQQPARAEAHA